MRQAIFGGVNRSFSNNFCALAKAELGAVNPHAMQDHRKLARDRDNRVHHARPLGNPQSPGLDSRPLARADQQARGSLAQRPAHLPVALLGDPPFAVDCAGLPSLGCQAEVCADRPGPPEAQRVIDAGTE